MINLKVKTLDSQNHDFSVDDDITVRQFKEHIAEKINVAVDMQRLIYCGRVLSDDKALKEYDVNGKVVHLVQRAPPSARGASSGGGSSSLGEDGARNTARRSRSSDNAARPQIFRGLDDFNTMYFGSMTSIPLNVNATTPPQIPTVSPSSTLCMNRITVARHMLQCADNIVSFLEAPERGLNNTAMDILSQQTMESTVFEVGISAVGDVDIPQNQMQNFVQAFQGAVSAAFRQNGISNVTVQQQDTTTPSVQVFGTIPDSAMTTPPNTSATATPAQESSGASSGSSSTSSSTSESSADSRRQARPGSSRNQTTSTQTLAEVVQQMRNVQRRMEPFMQRYYEILQNDPTFGDGDATARQDAQRVFDRISEALHYMSHAQHAISDLMLDLQTSTPRHLCCRPILVEQSAFVSSGIAAVPNNINLANLLRATNNNNNTEMGNNINAQIINLSIPGMTGPIAGQAVPVQPPTPIGSQNRSTGASGSTSGAQTAGGGDTATANQHNQGQQQQQQQQVNNANNSNNSAQMQVARLIQAVVNAAPVHADIHVQINAGGNSPASTSSNTSGAGQTANPTMTNNTTTNTNGAGSENGSQSRFATVTLPTTSTQTRSTSRPHVHSMPPPNIRNVRPLPANMLCSFDRFLPCNSHHIRENIDRVSAETATARNNQTNSNNNSNGSTPTPTAARSRTDSELSSLPLNLFGIPFTFADLQQIVPHPNTLNRIRDSLQSFVVETLFTGQAISDEAMENAMNLLIRRLEPILTIVSNYDLPDYDTRASIENLIRNSIPFCINLIREDSSQQFGPRLLRSLVTFFRRFFMILITCIGHENAESFSGQLVDMAIHNTQGAGFVRMELYDLFMHAIERQLDRTSQQDHHEIQEFLVIRRNGPNQPNNQLEPIFLLQPMEVDEPESTTPELVSDIAEISISIEPPIVNIEQCAAIVISAGPASAAVQPLVTATITPQSTSSPAPTIENSEDVTMSTPIAIVDPQVPPPLEKKDEEQDIPPVVVGSESWHSHLPSTWLPVITRDIARQRRQNPHSPFSDAYISGMSSKRRKLIAETKPPSDIPSLISDGVRHAFQSTGINPASVNGSNSSTAANNAAGSRLTALDELASSISDDTAVQGSYCEAMKASIRERLAKDSDYDAGRFPNCSKYFEK
ncbi:large proline-rich protein BAG6 isoform X4 [Toxorhynchites rutilus septentrionalis]|uniref:large proline-rich protein BAG6 isoform X4 n=1 Tax=Toxorhynchites rutilus septentrionalis TaxID=329112 RepID=UPI00247A77D1|nr:large proline-rich protein BAG6 isoform X4 [Toxorhynchites rutilus septentrionalis]